REEYGDEDVQHALLRVLRADFNDLLGVGHTGFFGAVQLDVALDEFHRAVSARGHGLRGRASEPVNHSAAGDQAEYEGSVEERKLVQVVGEAVGKRHDDGEDHGGCADHGRADEDWLCGGLERVAGAVVGFQEILGALEIHVDVVVLLQFRLDVGNLLDHRKLKHGWRGVGDRTVGIHGDGYRPHAEEAESHQAESENRRRTHHVGEPQVADQVADGHKADDRTAQVVAREIAGHKSGEDAQGCPALLRGDNHFFYVARFRRGEDFDQFGDDRSGQGAAGDDGGKLPPLGRVAAEGGNNQPRNRIGEGDGNERGDPHQPGERRLEVHFRGVAVAGFLDGVIDEVGGRAGDQHDHAHHEDPHQQLNLDRGIFHREKDESDQGHARHAIGLEAIGGGANRVARVVAGAIGDDAGVARVVFLDLEDDLHQVGPDVRDLGEDAARDTQRGGPQRFADGESDETRSGVFARNDQQHQKLDAN